MLIQGSSIWWSQENCLNILFWKCLSMQLLCFFSFCVSLECHCPNTITKNTFLSLLEKGFYLSFTWEIMNGRHKYLPLYALDFCSTEGKVVMVISSISNNKVFFFFFQNYKVCATYLSLSVKIRGKKKVSTSVWN